MSKALSIALCAVLWLPCGARGQEHEGEGAAPAIPVALTPPALLRFVEAPYPREAEAKGQAASVWLQIDVDIEGTVTAVEVVEVQAEGHAEAFAAAAREAATAFRFEPARRGGAPVPSRIGYRYEFLPPPPPTAPPAAPPAAPAPLAAVEPAEEAGADALPEYGATASGEAASGSVTERDVPRDTALRMAGTRGDALRAVELMPGVGRAPFNDGSVIVRGSAPQDSQVMLEGAPVLLLYHFGGLTSFFNSQLLDDVELYPGNFSVRYGRALGGIVDVTVRDPRRDALHGVIDVNLIDASLVVEAPLGKRGAIALAGRRSWIDAVFDKVVPDAAFDVVAAPVYYDYQAVATLQLGERDQLRWLAYGSSDRLRFVLSEPVDGEPDLRGDIDGLTQFHRAEMAWKHRYSARSRHTISVGGGWLGMDVTLGELVQQSIQGPRLYARAEWEHALSDRVSLRYGLDYYAISAQVVYQGSPWVQDSAAQEAPPIEVDGRATVHRPAAYAELGLAVTERLRLTPGVRVDYSSDAGQVTVDPRLAGRLEIGPRTALKAGVGWFHQPPDLGSHIEGLGNPDVKSSDALHTSFGIEQGVVEGLTFELEGYYKQLWNLLVDTPNNEAPHVVNQGEGRIYGAELSGRYESERVFGYASYTLSRSERRRQGEVEWALFAYDQPHILTVSSGARWPKGWELSGTFRLTSGTPYTPIVQGLYDANQGGYLGLEGARNSARNPLFHRLDVRLLKRWSIGRGSIAAYLDVQNVYNAQPTEGVGYSFDYRERETIGGLPIVPCLGLRGEL